MSAGMEYIEMRLSSVREVVSVAAVVAFVMIANLTSVAQANSIVQRSVSAPALSGTVYIGGKPVKGGYTPDQ